MFQVPASCSIRVCFFLALRRHARGLRRGGKRPGCLHDCRVLTECYFEGLIKFSVRAHGRGERAIIERPWSQEARKSSAVLSRRKSRPIRPRPRTGEVLCKTRDKNYAEIFQRNARISKNATCQESETAWKLKRFRSKRKMYLPRLRS